MSTWPVFSDYSGQGERQRGQLRDMVMAQTSHGIVLTARHAINLDEPDLFNQTSPTFSTRRSSTS